jgi:hypothetical protein
VPVVIRGNCHQSDVVPGEKVALLDCTLRARPFLASNHAGTGRVQSVPDGHVQQRSKPLPVRGHRCRPRTLQKLRDQSSVSVAKCNHTLRCLVSLSDTLKWLTVGPKRCAWRCDPLGLYRAMIWRGRLFKVFVIQRPQELHGNRPCDIMAFLRQSMYCETSAIGRACQPTRGPPGIRTKAMSPNLGRRHKTRLAFDGRGHSRQI